MRRKLFGIFVVLTAICYIFDFVNMELQGNYFENYFGSKADFEGIVKNIRELSDEALQVEIEVTGANGLTPKFDDRLLLSYYGEKTKAYAVFADRISFSAKVEKPLGQRNPRCFDYRKNLRSRGVGAIGRLLEFRVCEQRTGIITKYRKWLFARKNDFIDCLRADVKGLVAGILFGETSYLEEAAYENFSRNGTAHILAVSGLHVGIIYSIYKKICGNRYSILSIAMLALMLLSYGELSSWSTSVVRATGMIALSIAARIGDLRYDSLTGLSFVGIIMIICNPYSVFGAGFAMSFLAICSISFIKPVLPLWIPESLRIVVAVNLGMLPYQLYTFNIFAPVSIIANIPVVYLTGIFVPVAIAGFILSSVGISADAVQWVIGGMALLLEKVNGFIAEAFGLSFDVPIGFTAAVIFIGGFIFIYSSEMFTIAKLRNEYRSVLRVTLLLLIFSLAAGYLTYSEISDDDIVFVDVGQGDCVHIRDGDTDVLIDGGGSINYNVGKKILKPYLLKNGVRNLDAAIVTHEHMDHYKGIEELQQVYNVKQLIRRQVSGNKIQVSPEVTIQTLWPEKIDSEAGQDENKNCSVFMVSYRVGQDTVKILVTGDLDAEGERGMLKKYGRSRILEADILKIGHHGSPYSTCDEFLEAVNPRYAVIQCGKNNYGHPSPKVIEKCLKKDIIVFRNDSNGAVGFSLREGELNAHVMIGN